MNAPFNRSDFKLELDLAKMNAIASNIVKWHRSHAEAHEAYHEHPLAFIECLLDNIVSEGGFPRRELPEELAALAPWLDADACGNLVDVYINSRCE